MRITLVAIYDLYSYGIRGIHATLAKNGHEVKSIFFKSSTYEDNHYLPEEVDGLVELIVSTEPQLIGIGVRSPLFPLFKELSEKLRTLLTSAKILVGGHHALAAPESFLSYADFICMGEGEEIAKELCHELDVSIRGIYPNPPAPQIQNLDAVEFGYYGDDCIYYLSTEPKDETRMSIYACRGCFFNCAFCFEEILKKHYDHYKVRRKSVGRVMQEIKRYQGMFPKLEEIVFSDQNFTWGIDWIDEFCKKFSKTGLKFRCFGHVSLATEEMLKKLRDAGLHIISFGVESGSPQLRKLYNRKESLLKTIKLSEIIVKLGIQPRFDFIVNNPFETLEDWQETKKFINRLARPCVIRNFDLRFFPASPLTKYALKQRIITEENIEGNMDCKFGNWCFNYELY